MDLLHGLREKLRFIEPMHQQATASFVEKKRQIENSEGDFDYSGLDPDSWDGTPPFLEDWQEAVEAINLLGQACLCLVQSALKEYLEGCVALTNGKHSGRETIVGSTRTGASFKRNLELIGTSRRCLSILSKRSTWLATMRNMPGESSG